MSIDRFLKAQKNTYEEALAEIKNGKKRSHWIWFIFPQIQGLGFSEISQEYAIKDLEEAREYLNNSLLKERLLEISKALIDLPEFDPTKVMGYMRYVLLREGSSTVTAKETSAFTLRARYLAVPSATCSFLTTLLT